MTVWPVFPDSGVSRDRLVRVEKACDRVSRAVPSKNGADWCAVSAMQTAGFTSIGF